METTPSTFSKLSRARTSTVKCLPPLSLTATLSPEMLTEISNCLLLKDKLNICKTDRLFKLLTASALDIKKRLVLTIGYKCEPNLKCSAYRANLQSDLQLGLFRAAVRRLLEQQQEQPQNLEQQRALFTRTSTVFEEHDDSFYDRAMQQWSQVRKTSSCRRLDAAALPFRLPVAVAFRKAGIDPRLLHSIKVFEVHYTSHQAYSLEMAMAALGALLHKLRPNGRKKKKPSVSLTAFAFYAQTLSSYDFILNFLCQLYRLLSSSVTVAATANLNSSAKCTSKQKSNQNLTSSLMTLNSLTLFTRRQLRDSSHEVVENVQHAMFDVKPTLKSTSGDKILPIFPAVEELTLGGIDGVELQFFLSRLFPALRRLVLVLEKTSDNDAGVSVAALERHVSAMEEKLRHQLTHISVYSFDRLLAMHRAKNKEKEKRFINLACGELVAFVKKQFPNVVHFNGESI